MAKKIELTLTNLYKVIEADAEKHKKKKKHSKKEILEYLDLIQCQSRTIIELQRIREELLEIIKGHVKIITKLK